MITTVARCDRCGHTWIWKRAPPRCNKCWSWKQVRVINTEELAQVYDQKYPPFLSLSSAPQIPARAQTPASLPMGMDAEEATADRRAPHHETLAGPPRFSSESTTREISRPPPPSPAPRTSTPAPAAPPRSTSSTPKPRVEDTKPTKPTTGGVPPSFTEPPPTFSPRPAEPHVDTAWLRVIYLAKAWSNKSYEDQHHLIRGAIQTRAQDLVREIGTKEARAEADALMGMRYNVVELDRMREQWLEGIEGRGGR